MRTLLVLRHAETEATRPASTDRARRLTPAGEQQAAELGEALRHRGTTVDLALCSPATRARQTLAGLGLGCTTETLDELYDAGGEQILGLLRQTPDDVRTLLVVGHAPGLPFLAADLADPGSSDRQALDLVGTRYPPATLACLAVTGRWAELRTARLTDVLVPASPR